MPRWTPLDPDTATGNTKELLDAVHAALGVTPNMTRQMAVNPSVLQGWLELNGTLGRTLPTQLNELIAIAVAEQNNCSYCLSAHTAIGKMVGIEHAELALSRAGNSSDPKIVAALTFAQAINTKRGAVSDQDVALVRAGGYDDGEIAAIVAQVAINVFTNYFNLVAQPMIDFPVATPGMATAA